MIVYLVNYRTDPELFEKKAEILKALSHPVRLCIVKNLSEVEGSNVTNMQHCFELPQSTVSQHLAVLRILGIIKGNRNGLEIVYSLRNEKVRELIKLLFE